jgi:hypothetical protein
MKVAGDDEVLVESRRCEMPAAAKADAEHVEKVGVGRARDAVGGGDGKDERGDWAWANGSGLGDPGGERAAEDVQAQVGGETGVGVALPVGAIKQPKRARVFPYNQ